MRFVLCLILTLFSFTSASADGKDRLVENPIPKPAPTKGRDEDDRPLTPILRRQKVVQTSATAVQPRKPTPQDLDTKLQELAKLQSEIARLAGESERPTRVRVSVQVVEIQTEKLRQRKLTHPFRFPDPSIVPATQHQDFLRFSDQGVLQNSVGNLLLDQLARDVGTTSVTATPGQPLELTLVGEPGLIPIPRAGGGVELARKETAKFEIEVRPTQSTGGDISLHVIGQIVGEDHQTALWVEGRPVSAWLTRKTWSDIQVKPGETIVFRGQYRVGSNLTTTEAHAAVLGALPKVLRPKSSPVIEREVFWIISCDLVPGAGLAGH